MFDLAGLCSVWSQSVVSTVARRVGRVLGWSHQSVSGSAWERPPNRPAAHQPRRVRRSRFGISAEASDIRRGGVA